MTRLYLSQILSANQLVGLSPAQTHYLKNVLRAVCGHEVRVFNERDGEWHATVASIAKKSITLKLENLMRPVHPISEIALLFAPLKHDALTFLMEKATELGVRSFYPVMTERCNVSRINHKRLHATVTDATQQCERFDIPEINPLGPLTRRLEKWPSGIPLYVCRERGAATNIIQAFEGLSQNRKPAFLIGPEGGFSPAEIDYLDRLPFTRFVSLGPRILRSETAALAVLSCYQALAGDWQEVPGSDL